MAQAKKIKLVISDLHLGVGRTLENGQINFLEEFNFDEKFTEFIQYHTTGKFADYHVELILNGDILNFLQVDYKGHNLTVLTEDIALNKLKRIIDGHPVFFKTLKDFAARQGNEVTYIVGNHDQDMLWTGARDLFNEAVGVPIRYKNLVYYFDGVHIEHGHMYEAANRVDPRKFYLKKNLPEPILNLPFGSHFFVDFVLKIKTAYPSVDKIRPFNRMIRWGLFNETWFVLKGIYGLLIYFAKSAFIKDPRRAFSIKSIVKIFFESAVFPDLSESAKRILRDDRIHTVVFGHTHVYQYRQWSGEMEYFNTGTWTDITSLDIASLGKITSLTYVLFEYDEEEERPRGRLKEWVGYHRVEQDVSIG